MEVKPTNGCIFAFIAVLSISIPPSSVRAGAQSGTMQGSPHPATTQASREVVAKFEVASVRLNSPESGLCTINNSGSPLFSAHNATMRLLVGLAFGLSSLHITAAPNWFDSQLYDVNAKAEGDAPLTPKQFQPLLQQLLKDRFHLAAHRETVYHSGYALVVAKNGPRLRPRKSDSQAGYIVPDGLNFAGVSMETLAGVFASVTGIPVADKTGIKGEYSVDLRYAPRDATESELPNFFDALQDELGLKLIPEKKVPVEVLVIDSVERVPTEN